MRRKALLSIMTLYHHDPTVFDRLQLPKGPSENPDVKYADLFTPDKNILVAGILTECAELEILFTDPDTIKDMLYFWSLRRLPVWQKLLDSCLFKYNPIWNVDGDVQTDRSGSNENNYGKDGTSEDQTITQVAAFDSTGWQNASKENSNGSWTEDGGDHGSHEDSEHVRRTGNIGVTMTQDMIQRERDIALFSWYDYIITDFKRQFCLLVY